MENKEKWANVQLTKEQAISIYDSKVWEKWTPKQIVDFQLFQRNLCLEFGHFQECLSKVLGRPVFTHELAFRDSIVKEYLGETPPPNFEQIINLIPKDKRIIIGI